MTRTTPAPLDPHALAAVKLLLLDVDGVMTDGRLWFGDGGSMKAFHVRDGLGIALLHRAGVETGIVSGRDEAFVRRRAEELKMAVVALGVEDKGRYVAKVIADRKLAREAVAFVGDDVNDVSAFRAVGVPIAVADAHADALAAARFVTRTRGGKGAVREVADALLAARARPAAARAGESA